MNDRPTASTITDAQLDQLLLERDAARRMLNADDLRLVDEMTATVEQYRGRATSAEAELARLRAGEEPVTDPAVQLTPGQWIWEWNQATPETRLQAAERVMWDTARASKCLMMAHESRLDEDRHAWVAIARVRDVLADMERITGARHWARILRRAIDGEDGTPLTHTGQTPVGDDPLSLPRDMATVLHRALGQLLGDEGAQAIARVRELHRQAYDACDWCSTNDRHVPWPCPTITALDGQEQQ